MYKLDTNFFSEATKPTTNPSVAAWLGQCPATMMMMTTAIARSEILQGVRGLPSGHGHDQFERAAHALVAEVLGGRVLAFDDDGAGTTADIRVAREAAGTPVSTTENAMIAGTAQRWSHGTGTSAFIVCRG